MLHKLAVFSLITIANFAFASNDVINTSTLNTTVQDTQSNSTQVGNAKDWELTDKEWNEYLHLMQRNSQFYYKKLSPPEILGIYASNPEELRHYAEISAKLEHDKLERELRFNVAFHEAANRLYASEPIIRPFDITPFTPKP